MNVNKNILHIEDDPNMQQYVSVLLSDVASITSAGTLKEARELTDEKQFDLVIVDFTLPDGSGSSFVIELAEKNPSVPVVVFSAHEITDTMTNVSHVFVKGRFINQEFIDTIRDLCSLND